MMWSISIKAAGVVESRASFLKSPRRQSSQEGVRGQWKLPHPDARRVVGRVGDRGCCAHDPDLAESPSPQRARGRFMLLEPDCLEVLDVCAGGDVVVREVVVHD